MRLSATTWASSPAERGKKAAELRLRWLRELRRARTILNRGLRQFAAERSNDPTAAKVEEAKAPHRAQSVLLGLAVLATVAIIALLSAVGYVLAIAASAPDLSELKPADKGQLSVVYAADGSRLGFIQSDVLRRVIPVARHPGEPAPRHRRHRGRALLQARRRRPERDRPRRHQEPRVRQDRAGRLDDHPAARAGALHQGPEARLRAQDPRSEARLRAGGQALQDLGPAQLPELGALRNGRRPHGDRGGGRGGHVLQQARRRASSSTSPRCSPACRRRRPSTTRSGTPRQAALARRNEVLRQMVKNGYITQAEAGEASQRGLGSTARHPLHPPPRALLLRLRAGQADRALRRRRGAPRRPAHPHDDRSADLQDVARGDQRLLRRPRRPELGARRHRPVERQDPGDGLERDLQDRKFNLAAQGHRQPGSAFKTFVLTTAIRQGVDPTPPTTPRSRWTSTTPTSGTGRSRRSGTRTSAPSASPAPRCRRTTRSMRS